MKKRFLSLFALCLVCLLGVTSNAWGNTATCTSLSSKSTDAQTVEAGKPITYKCGTSNSYENPARIYQGKTFTIASTDGSTITKIEITSPSGNPATGFSADVGSYSATTILGTWTATNSTTTSVVFTASAQVRVSQIVVTYTPIGGGNQVAEPVFSVSSGSYTENQNVEITCSTDGASIYYTLDGSSPTSSSTLYESAIPVTATTTIKAIGIKDGLDNSTVASATYTLNIFNSLEALAAATITSGTTVKVTFEDVPIKDFYTYNSNRNGVYFDIQKDGHDIEIYYSGVPSDWVVGGKLSGTITCPWKNYSGTWELAPVADSWNWNNLTYKTAATTPTISIVAGTYYEDQTVSLETTTDGASIYYTLDGTDPTDGSTSYATPITINKSCTLKARAYKDDMDPSNVASAEYVLKVVTPTVSVPGGVYSLAQNVVLATTTPDATIRYTLDGSDVTDASTVYSSAIDISTATTLKAKAFKNDWATSEQIEASYTFASAATITLMDKGSQYGEVINTSVGANVVTALSGVTAPTSRPTMSDYTFKGWAQTQSTTTPNIITNETTVPDGGMTLYAIYGKTAEDKVTWEAEDLADLKSSDVFVITGTNATATYSMSNGNGTSSAPTAKAVTIAAGKITSEVSATQKWNISGDATSGYTFYPNGSTTTWLYCTNSNNGVRVGTNTDKTFVVDGGYLKHVMHSRYVGVYDNTDWRCYTSKTGNIASQTFAFYKQVIEPGTTTYDFEASDRSLTVTYDANGAEGDVPTCSTLYAEGETHTVLGVGELSMEGHNFAYWTTDQAGEGTQYSAGSNYEFGATSVTFYAQWTPISYNVSVGNVDGVTVTATYNTSESIAEGENADVPYGTKVTLTATGLGTNQDICWTVDGATVSASKGTPVTFTVGNSAVTVSATVQTVHRYALVTSDADLVAGGQYILVSTKTDGTSYVANGVKNGDYLEAVDIPAPTANVISIIDEKVAPIVLGKDGDNWFINMTIGQIGTSAAKKMTVGASTLTWTISISDNVASITSTTSSYGTIKYNRSSPRFLNYASGQADIYLYKLDETATTGTFSTPSTEVYTTFYTTDEFLMPEGAQGGVVNAKGDNSVTIDYLFPAGSVVPAETPLLIKGTASTKFTYTKTVLGSEFTGVNYLMGVPSANYETVAPEEGDYYFYKLTYNNTTEKILGFYWGADNGAAFQMKSAGKAYLALPKGAGIKSIVLDDEEATAISFVNINENAESYTMFNLAGQTVGRDYNGIVIKNGKKYINK